MFDRAAARDFADVYVLAGSFGEEMLLARAAEIEAGSGPRILADMIGTLDGSQTTKYPSPTARPGPELRRFCAAWRTELSA
jgi:hypothetical protein